MSPLVILALCGLTLPFVVALRSDWVLRRLALRYPRRRPVESALLVLGALFGTAIITASLIVGDTLDHSITGSAATDLGEVDELVTTRDPAIHDGLAARLEPLRSDPDVDGIVSLVTAPVAVRADGDGGRSAPGSKLIEVDFAAARTFGGGRGAPDLRGPTPGRGEVVLNDDLATALAVRTGDRVTVHIGDTDLRLEVTGTAGRRGLSGFRPNALDRGRNLFVAPGTVDDAVAPDGTGAASVERSLALSNTGGPLEGVERSETVTARMRALLEDVPAVVRPVKADMTETAERTSTQLGELFLAMGAFGGLAGALLVVNLFVMLAEERKVQLGMFRALGMSRTALVRAFSVEGWLYGLVASTLGTVAGLGLGRVIVVLVGNSIEQVDEVNGLRLAFHFDPASIRDGFLIGLVVATGTVVLASVRFARLNIISAVRDLPSPPTAGQPRWVVPAALGAALAGAAWAIYGFAADDGVSIVVGPVVAAAGAIAPALRRHATSVGTTGLLASMVWSAVAIRIVLDRVPEPDVTTFVAQGVVLTASAVALVALHQDRLAPIARTLLRGPRSLVLALGLAYPLARRVRTALTVGMYALVVFTLAFISVLSSMFTSQLGRTAQEISGGADLVVRSVNGAPLPLGELRGHGGVDDVAPLAQQQVLVVEPGTPVDGTQPMVWFASTFDQDLIDLGPPSLRDRGRFESDELAYLSVLRDPGAAIIDPVLAATLRETMGRVGVGSRLELLDPASGTARTVRVVAIAPSDLALNGILVGTPIVPAGTALPPNRALVAGTGGTSLADALSADLASSGAEAETFTSIVDRATTTEARFFDLARGYLALGMVVGIAGLGVVLVRSVRERRRAIGVLRSLGLQPRYIGWSFLVEATLVAAQGTVIGAALGVFTAYNIVNSTSLVGLDVRFVLPIGAVSVLVLLVIAASLVITAVPARRAAAVRPAVALRIAD